MTEEVHELNLNIAGKVKNTRLSPKKPLYPLYEAISNSIHSLEDLWGNQHSKKLIQVRVIRRGKPERLETLESVDISPIVGFEIVDNGIGFTDSNFTSFKTSDSDYKVARGAKGIGRFVCLKVFNKVSVDSNYLDGKIKFHRSFDFIARDKGIINYKRQKPERDITGTKVTLMGMKEEYEKNCPKSLMTVVESVIEHFLVNFILKSVPEIEFVEQNGDTIKANDVFKEQSKSSVQSLPFKIQNEDFIVHLVKLHKVGSSKHEMHLCANERDVLSVRLNNFIRDLEKSITDDKGEHFVYHAYILGKYLDDHVDSERTNFNFATGEEGDEGYGSLTLKEIKTGSALAVEELLKDYLQVVRGEKLERISSYIKDEAPQYGAILKHRPEVLDEISPELEGNKLNIELFKLQSDWEAEVKQLGEEFLKPKEDITDDEEYKRLYEDYVEKFNDVGKSNLAKYIVHRKAVINLLDNFLGEDEEGNFMTEDVIHNIFFPIRSYSDEISYDKQNLWLIDERLSYHSYLASDKTFSNVEPVDSESADRTDLLIFNDAFAFVNDDKPYNSITIVEFKRPERKGYSTSDPKKNPVDQVTEYIKEIRKSKVTDRKGKVIDINAERTPFYAYVVCDFNPSLKDVLETRDYTETPDGAGYFTFHDKYNAYIEVISYEKLLVDARKRNNILFDKLGLPI